MYVLKATLQDVKKLPKWSKRAYRGIFLGFSEQHHSTVALVLNPETGNVSPQYHVVFDERFSTVIAEDNDNFQEDEWERLFDIGYERYFDLETIEDEEGSPPSILPPDIDLWPQLASRRNSPARTTTDSNTQTNNDSRDSAVQASVEQREQQVQTIPEDHALQREVQTQTDTEFQRERGRTVRFVDKLDARTQQTQQTRSGRQVRPPRCLRDEAFPAQRLNLTSQQNLSKQTFF